MEGKKTFIAYCDWLDLIEDLEDAEAGRVLKWLLNYVNDKEPTPPSEKHLKIVCKVMKSQLKEDLEKWKETIEIKREAGRKGGLAKSSNAKQNLAQPSTSKQDLANQAVYDNDNVNDNDNVIYGNKLPVYNNAREKESINVLQNLIQEIEKRFNRVLTIYETTTIQDLAKSFTATQILNEIEANMDKEKPINYIKSKLEHAMIKKPIIEEEKKTTYPTEINSWIDAWKISVSDEAPQYLKEKAKAYMEGK